MNKILTALLVSAAVLVGLVLSVSAFAVVMPYGHMLFSVPWWGHMSDSGHMMGYHETTGHHYSNGQSWYDCPRSGYWDAHDGHHMMNGRHMSDGPGTAHGRGMMGDYDSVGGYGPMHGPGMMSGSAMTAGHGMR